MRYIVAPTADFDGSGNLTTLANALFRPTNALTGLLNGTSYRAHALSDPSGNFTPALPILGSTSDAGHKIVVALPSGFVSTNETIVNPSLVTVTINTPSVDSLGVANAITTTRRVGYRADVVGAEMHIWMRQPIPASATAITLNIAASAITNGASTCAPFTAIVSNLSDQNQKVVAHLLRSVDTTDDYGVAHSVIANPFWLEGYAWHESGIACVKFEVVGSVTRTSYAIIETRSRYRDSELITSAQWTKNGSGGIGVYSSAQINPADFADGEAAVTMTAYARVGGVAVTRVVTWTICMNAGGTYVPRTRFVDNVAGNDTWDGTTAVFVSGTIGPKLTMSAACLSAGSVTGGATAFSIPTVRCVGSGDALNPRIYQLYSGTGTGNAIPSATHTWLTIEPAPGYTGADTQIANYGAAAGVSPRIRRLKIKNMWWDIANVAGGLGTLSTTLLGNNTTVYNSDTNPAACWFDKVESYHHLGRLGQQDEGNSGLMLSTSWTKKTRAFYTNFVARDMARRGFSSPALSVAWNYRLDRVFKDVVKGPDCLVAGVWRDNATPKEFLPVTNLSGTPLSGDVISSVYSVGAETVGSFLATTAGNGTVTLTSGGDSYTFKKDDSQTSRRITVASPVGTFTALQTITVGASSYIIGRVEGNDLYLRTAASVTNGVTVTGPTGSGTVGSNAIAQCLLFTGSGVRGMANPPHPDGLQIQDFVNQEYLIAPIAGIFQVGETVSATGASGVVVSQTGNRLRTSGTNQWNLAAIGATITGATSGATATYQGARRFVDNDKNVLIYCLLGEKIDGQPLFSENGSAAVALINISIVGLFGDTSLQTQTGSIPDYGLVHVTHPNKRMALRTPADMAIAGRAHATHRWNIAEGLSSDVTPQGAASANVDAWQPGSDIVGNHALNPAPNYSEFDSGMTRGNALWTNGSGNLEDFDPLRVTFQPGVGSPVKSKVPAGMREVRYDLFGNERPNDGTASAGAVEEWSV